MEPAPSPVSGDKKNGLLAASAALCLGEHLIDLRIMLVGIFQFGKVDNPEPASAA